MQLSSENATKGISGKAFLRLSAVCTKLVIRSLIRQRAKHFLTFVIMGICISGVLLIGGIKNVGINILDTATSIHDYYGDFTIFKAGGAVRKANPPDEYLITMEQKDSILAKVSAMPEVDAAGAYLMTSGLMTNGCDSIPIQVIGIDENIDKSLVDGAKVKAWTPLHHQIYQGKSLTEFSSSEKYPIFITPLLSSIIGKPSIGRPMEDPNYLYEQCGTSDMAGATMKDSEVRLLFTDNEGNLIILDSIIQAHRTTGSAYNNQFTIFAKYSDIAENLDKKSASHVAVFLKDNVDPVKFRNELGRKLATEPNLEFYSLRDATFNFHNVGLSKWLGNIELLNYVLMSLLTLVCVANFIGISIAERSSEIGTLRSVGFTAPFVGAIFALETFIVGIISTIFGIMVTLVVVASFQYWGLKFQPPSLAYPALLIPTPKLINSILQVSAILVMNTVAGFIAVKIQLRHKSLANQSLNL